MATSYDQTIILDSANDCCLADDQNYIDLYTIGVASVMHDNVQRKKVIDFTEGKIIDRNSSIGPA